MTHSAEPDSPGSSESNSRHRPRGRRWLATEGARALGEFGALVSVAPMLDLAPRGDGHPVLVMPGLGGDDESTIVIRRYLDRRGYRTHAWGLGRNLGPAMSRLAVRLRNRLQDINDSAGEPVSLVGWSLGGVYARQLARRDPRRVRQVVTLGSPIGGRFAGAGAGDAPGAGTLPLPGTPSTAVFSKSDGVVPWRIAVQQPSVTADNVEVFGSHLGLGVNPSVLFVLADRLAQPANRWRPFDRDGWKRWVYGAATLA